MLNQLYIKASRNQRANAKNPYQSKAPKALCVCSAGLLRSPTIAKVLLGKGYNTRACGASLEYALIPLSQALLYWADKIFVVKEQEAVVKAALKDLGYDTPVVVLDIPDAFEYNDPNLVQIIEDLLEDLPNES